MTTPSTAVLFVHGIQGQPKQFSSLIGGLPEGVELRAPLLPGHGKPVREFHASRRGDWLAAVRAETKALLAEGKRVVFVGHSMGCLLGLLVSRELGAPYAGMLLLCCPFRPRIAGRFGDLFKAIAGKNPAEDPRAAAALEGNSVPVNGFRESLYLLRPYGDLFWLMDRARQIRPQAPEKVKFFFSDNDEVVSAVSIRHTRKWPEAQVTILEGCGHCYFPDEAKNTLQQALIELIEGIHT
jgi:carboxylesterase